MFLQPMRFNLHLDNFKYFAEICIVQVIRRTTLADPSHSPISGATAFLSHGTAMAGGGFTAPEVRRRGCELHSYAVEDYLIGGSGSLPDLQQPAASSLTDAAGLSREEVARLSSQRRQEVQRMREEAELMRNNPLRGLRYIYHPAVRVS